MRHNNLSKAIADALAAEADALDLDDAQVFAYWQSFGSTAGPFRGIGGAAVTAWPIVLVIAPSREDGHAIAACYAGDRWLWRATTHPLRSLRFAEIASTRSLPTRLSEIEASSLFNGDVQICASIRR